MLKKVGSGEKNEEGPRGVSEKDIRSDGTSTLLIVKTQFVRKQHNRSLLESRSQYIEDETKVSENKKSRTQ